ncbi:helix-hairpin-helix domain-containing protein [Loigolactobacillus coryniformis subsp. coryniformis]|uniref:Competence protein ComE n=2 Tax=Loigolactobacillus coryniformis TaxID=1610 RepID=A0A2D1KNE2_9LACO|nr:helix-hairpin-helix domain-containing protein [Loigolactobacillus coryniformis]ATO43616.1 competence protein ComE [Loigolactobacillus coryniformis subsp. torquens DSM 20004 = KCTC 3535]KRK65924.1 ComE operon protein 1 [Loigolactobacillus coryniformis subsp. torquens DSM 20004 = KCTC 3535]MCL5458250.1 helix-hairpin-helix domain-containing protein [Loigolactobacillus coryniformis]
MLAAWEWLKQYWQFVIIGLLTVSVGLVLFLLLRTPAPTQKSDDVFTNSHSAVLATASTASATAPTTTQTGFVDVKGAVKKPGIYQVNDNTRLFDVVRLAGGLATDADQQQINLAQQLNDQQVVFIPKIGEEVPPQYAAPVATPATSEAPATATATTSKSTGGTQVNLNTATAEELQQLTGIGQKKAELIIQFRTEQGGFKQPEDLKKVSGIGDKTFESLKDSVTV